MTSPISTLATRAACEAFREAGKRAYDRTLRVKEPLTASQWADRFFYLSPESSGTEGRWETLPYQVAMLDVMGADEPRIVDVKKCARVGYTKMLDAMVGYSLEHKRRNSVMYQPTDGDAKEFCKSEIDTMVRDVPVLSKLSDDQENKKRDDTLTMKRLGKKLLYILGGKAPARFRRVTADLVVYDELDGFDREIGDEGDPLKLGDRCITNSPFPKSIRGSTPRTKHNSLIEKESTNARHLFEYHVHCPECMHAQPLRWAQMKWDADGTPEERSASVRYVCKECSVPWHYSEIWSLLDGGFWATVEKDPETEEISPGYRIQTGDSDPVLVDADGITVDWPRHVAFHIWAAYSPFFAWEEMVAEWLEAQGDYLKLKTFTNHRLGECWVEEGEQLDANTIFENREQFDVPDDVLAVISTVDIQHNRVEVETAGFGIGAEAWHLEHRVIYGDTEKLWAEGTTEFDPVWRDLNNYLATASYKRDDGVVLVIDAVGIDTGDRTETAYRFCKKCAHPRVFALKGIGGDGRPVVSAPSRQQTVDREAIDLFGVGVDSAKAMVLNRITNAEKQKRPGIHLNMDVTLELCEQLTAEVRMTKFRRGFEVREWVKTRPRNEFFDLWVYQLAVLTILNPSWRALEEQRSPEAQKKKQEQQERPRSGGSWVTNWRQ